MLAERSRHPREGRRGSGASSSGGGDGKFGKLGDVQAEGVQALHIENWGLMKTIHALSNACVSVARLMRHGPLW